MVTHYSGPIGTLYWTKHIRSRRHCTFVRLKVQIGYHDCNEYVNVRFQQFTKFAINHNVMVIILFVQNLWYRLNHNRYKRVCVVHVKERSNGKV